MPVYAMVLVGSTILLSVAVTIMAGRARRAKFEKYNAESVAFIGAALNALFIAILAFYIVIAWQNSDTTSQQATNESASLVDLYWRTTVVPQPQQDRIRSLIRDYTTEVVEREWPLLAEGHEDPNSAKLLNSLRQEINRLPVTSQEVKAIYDQAQRDMRTVTDSRRERIAQATGDDELLRLLLIGSLAGAMVTLAFPVLVGLRAETRHLLAIAILAGALSSTTYVVLELGHPFRGLVEIGPDAFRMASEEYLSIP